MHKFVLSYCFCTWLYTYNTLKSLESHCKNKKIGFYNRSCLLLGLGDFYSKFVFFIDRQDSVWIESLKILILRLSAPLIFEKVIKDSEMCVNYGYNY